MVIVIDVVVGGDAVVIVIIVVMIVELNDSSSNTFKVHQWLEIACIKIKINDCERIWNYKIYYI